MRDLRGNTQVLFLYKLKRLTPDGTEATVYYVGSSWQKVKKEAYRLTDEHILSVEVLRPVQVLLSDLN